MISLRYHIVTIIAVFLALGIGILLGGTLGQQWLTEKQQIVFNKLEQSYEEQITENRELTTEVSKLRQSFEEQMDKSRRLLRLTSGDALRDRFFIVFAGDKANAVKVENMIKWAGGHVRVLNSLQYLPIEADGIVLMGDSFPEQMNRDLLVDMQLMYQAPIVVHTGQLRNDEWHMDNIYAFHDPITEPLSEYHFLKYLQKVIPPFEEVKSEA